MDFAFRSGPLPSSNLIAKELFKIGFGFFASPDFLKQHKTPKNIEELIQLPAIGCTAEQVQLPWIYQEKGEQKFIIPNTRFRVKDQSIALKAAQEGLGVVFLPISLSQTSHDENGLQPILKSIWPKPTGFHIIYRDRENRISARYKAFLNFIHERIFGESSKREDRGR